LGIIIGIICELRRKTNCNVFAFDYSGYGLSSGKPSEANLYSDLESTVLSLNSRYNIGPQNIILFGRSICSVPTIDLSSRMNFAGVVLSASFMSGIRHFYPYKRRTWLFEPFPNIEKVHRIKSPVLVIHGTRDTTITVANFSPEHSGTEKDQRGYPLCLKLEIFIFIIKSFNI
jgi:fermentation-respiration switch protein FrsA (DUF1100 family)